MNLNGGSAEQFTPAGPHRWARDHRAFTLHFVKSRTIETSVRQRDQRRGSPAGNATRDKRARRRQRATADGGLATMHGRVPVGCRQKTPTSSANLSRYTWFRRWSIPVLISRDRGSPEDAAGRKCICNALFGRIGLGQRHDGIEEPDVVTSRDDLVSLPALRCRRSYRAADDYLLGTGGRVGQT